MSIKYEKNFYLATLAEQCGRYREMAFFLENMIKQKDKDKDLTADERDLLSTAYKKSVFEIKHALRTIMAYEVKEIKKENSIYLPYITQYKQLVADELTELCQGVLKIVENQLLNKAEDEEAKLFYIKMKGDFNRYMAEFTDGDIKKKVLDEALKAYEEATEIAKNLSYLNPIVLGLANNFSLFYYEEINDNKKAIEIAKNAVEKADKEFVNIPDEDDGNIDLNSVYILLKENIDIWINEEKENNI